MIYRIIFLLLIFTMAQSGQAVTYDSFAQGVLRTYPSGGAVEVNGGASWFLWNGQGPFYGYLRPNANFQTSSVTNQLRLQLDIFPISFFGFFVGVEWNKRDYEEFDTFNCESVECSGQVRRRYVGHKMALAFHQFFFTSQWRLERLEMTDRAGVFVDVKGSILARSSYDQKLEGQMVFGYKLNSDHSIGVLNVYNSTKYYNQLSSMWLAIHRVEFGRWSLLSGAGFIKTRHSTKVGTALFILRWTPAKGLPLF